MKIIDIKYENTFLNVIKCPADVYSIFCVSSLQLRYWSPGHTHMETMMRRDGASELELILGCHGY